MGGFDDIPARLDELRDAQLFRRRLVVDAPQGREVIVDGRALLNFCSNDYLGLAADPRVAAAFKAGIERWGTGAGASHVVCGHTAVHHELEEALAAFTGRERALLFSNGYAANMGVINALVGPGDAVFEDRLNHASLLDGGWISRAEFVWYRHADPAHLDQRLAARAAAPGRRLVVSDGTFSMDGDVCPLDATIDVARRHGAWLMIDDAHGLGAWGEGGRGLVDPRRYGTAEVPVLVGTLGKAFGTFGAFAAGDADFVEWLVQRARNYIFTTALPPAVAAATLASLGIVEREPWRRTHVAALIARFRQAMEELGYQLLPSATPIQPLMIGDPGRAVALSDALERRGCLIRPIRPPTVPKGTARLRITLTAAHTDADLDRLIDALDAAARELSPA